jgi:rfaE bifunctional protein kinase chain/domain
MNGLSPERVEELLDRARGVRVLVVGDVMLDVYLRGTATRISPEAPVPVVKVTGEWRALGGAANVAMNVVSLGASCEMVGCVGRDSAGEAVEQELARAGIGARGLWTCEDRPTTVKTRVMVQHHQVARYDREVDEEVDEEVAGELVGAIEELAPDVDAIVLEDYNKGVLAPAVIGAALEAGRRYGCPVVVDPKARRFFEYVGATVFKPNRSELGAALGGEVRAYDVEWMEQTRRRLGCSHLLVTLGEDGMALMTEEGEHVAVPATARAVYDVSGAGDTVTAVVAVALAAGATVVEAAVLANHAAGIEVSKPGVAPVSAEELLEAFRLQQAAGLPVG